MQKHILHPFKRRKHDHSRCIKNALQDAEAACLSGGLRLTELRRKVLELVWSSHAPVKAYDILDQMHKDNPKTAPPTVYRALEFLMAAGLTLHVRNDPHGPAEFPATVDQAAEDGTLGKTNSLL